jgi:hypothetical protein
MIDGIMEGLSLTDEEQVLGGQVLSMKAIHMHKHLAPGNSLAFTVAT